MSENPIYKTVKKPIGHSYHNDKGYGWIQVDKLIGADTNYGIVKSGVYKVLSYSELGVNVLSPEQPYRNKTRGLISSQYHWVSTKENFNPTIEDEELKVGDRVFLKEDYMGYKYGKVLKIKAIKFDSDGILVHVGCPQDDFWVYSHRIKKF